MNPVLIDTNVYAAFKRGWSDARAVMDRAPTIGVSTVVIGELLGGFARGSRAERNRQELAEFIALPRVVVLPVDEQTAEYYARVYAGLSSAGHPIPTNDMWIAATAMQHGYDLSSYDSHFEAVEQLSVVNPTGS